MKAHTYGLRLDSFLDDIQKGKDISDDIWDEMLADIDESVANVDIASNLIGRLRSLYEQFFSFLLREKIADNFAGSGSLSIDMLDLRKFETSPNRCSIWLHNDIKKDIVVAPGANHHHFITETLAWDGETLMAIADNKIQLRIDADPLILRYIELELSEYIGKTENEIMHGIELPVDLELFKEQVVGEVTRIKKMGDEILQISGLLRNSVRL